MPGRGCLIRHHDQVPVPRYSRARAGTCALCLEGAVIICMHDQIRIYLTDYAWSVDGRQVCRAFYDPIPSRLRWTVQSEQLHNGSPEHADAAQL